MVRRIAEACRCEEFCLSRYLSRSTFLSRPWSVRAKKLYDDEPQLAVT